MDPSACHAIEAPSEWVCRFAPLIARDGVALDVASGGGRHARHLAGLGLHVVAADRDLTALAALEGASGITAQVVDLETGAWPFTGRRFDGIVVTNYLHRPLFPHLLDALAPGGVLIYETFAAGNERYGRPRNPDFLLRPGELLEAVRGRLRVIAFEDLHVAAPKPAVVQRLCAALPAA